MGINLSYSVIPDCDRVFLPLEADLMIGILANLTEKELKNSIRFGFRNANDTPRKT